MTFVATGRNVGSAVTFRPTAEQQALIDELRATFGPREGASRCYSGASAGEAFRWLLDNPTVRAVIADRVSSTAFEQLVDVGRLQTFGDESQ